MAFTKHRPTRKPGAQAHWRDTPREASRPGPWEVPECALPIWLDADGNFRIGLPDHVNGRGHTVTIEQGEPAIFLLRRLLESRAAAPFARICEPASPTQHLLDAMAKALQGGATVTREKMKVEEIDDDDLRL